MVPTPFSGDRLAALREALTDFKLPIRVDVLDWHGITENFRQIIAARFEVIPKPEPATAPSFKLPDSRVVRVVW